MNKQELIELLTEYLNKKTNIDLLNNIRTLISYVSDNKGKWDLIDFWNKTAVIDPRDSKIWGEIKRMLHDYEEMKIEEKKPKIIERIEKYLANKTPMNEKELISIAKSLDYELEWGREGTSCKWKGTVITRIPRHKGDFPRGTGMNILTALYKRTQNMKLRGQMN